jgi:hypothetical protein
MCWNLGSFWRWLRSSENQIMLGWLGRSTWGQLLPSSHQFRDSDMSNRQIGQKLSRIVLSAICIAILGGSPAVMAQVSAPRGSVVDRDLNVGWLFKIAPPLLRAQQEITPPNTEKNALQLQPEKMNYRELVRYTRQRVQELDDVCHSGNRSACDLANDLETKVDFMRSSREICADGGRYFCAEVAHHSKTDIKDVACGYTA